MEVPEPGIKFYITAAAMPDPYSTAPQQVLSIFLKKHIIIWYFFFFFPNSLETVKFATFYVLFSYSCYAF